MGGNEMMWFLYLIGGLGLALLVWSVITGPGTYPGDYRSVEQRLQTAKLPQDGTWDIYHVIAGHPADSPHTCPRCLRYFVTGDVLPWARSAGDNLPGWYSSDSGQTPRTKFLNHVSAGVFRLNSSYPHGYQPDPLQKLWWDTQGRQRFREEFPLITETDGVNLRELLFLPYSGHRLACVEILRQWVKAGGPGDKATPPFPCTHVFPHRGNGLLEELIEDWSLPFRILSQQEPLPTPEEPLTGEP